MKKTNPFQIKSFQDDGSFEGILTVYNVVDGGNDIVEPGAYTKTINDHGSQIPMLWQHNSDEPIGTLTLVDGPDALRVKGQLMMDPNVPMAQKAYALIKNQIIKGLSIGYDAIKKEMDGSIRRLKEIRLWEGSIVTFPMAELSIITSVKARKDMGESEDDFNTELSEIQLYALPYQMHCALREALNECATCEAQPADKIAMSATIIEQFAAAYAAFIPAYIDLLDTDDDGPMYYMMGRGRHATKEGRTISAATNAQIKACHTKMMEGHTLITEAGDMLSALLPAEAGKSIPTPEAKAADPKTEPEELHSAAKILSDIRSLIPAA